MTGATRGSNDPKERIRRTAGQHALSEGRKKVALWSVAEIGASVFGLKNAEKSARRKADDARRTWIAGGEAEREVGEVLDRLCERGFYLYHDVALPGIGNVDHVAVGPSSIFAIETKSHKGKVGCRDGKLILNGKPTQKDFVAQAWRGAFRLKEITGAEVTPLLCFTRAFVEGRVYVRGVRVVPLKWLEGEVMSGRTGLDFRSVSRAVSAIGAATKSHPSAVPRRRKA